MDTCCDKIVGIRAWTCSRYWFVKVGGMKFGMEREVKLPRGGIGGMGGRAKEVRTRVRSTIRIITSQSFYLKATLLYSHTTEFSRSEELLNSVVLKYYGV